ncbi:MAG: hypothetical protein ABR927_19375 [Bacteroidales bacterium]|jgi:hypothetical protein
MEIKEIEIREKGTTDISKNLEIKEKGMIIHLTIRIKNKVKCRRAFILRETFELRLLPKQVINIAYQIGITYV